MKKMFAVLLCMMLMLCIGNASTAEETWRIGICQLVQHVALDAATQGFQDALTQKLGDRVSFDVQNASGDSSTCSAIVNNFISGNVDLIMANATPALQAAVAATGNIPVLGTSVTDYATALDIDNWTGATGFNESGTSDLAPLAQQADMLHELFPDAKKVGLLYYIPTDNTAASCTEAIRNVLEPARKPAVVGEEGICAGCGVATLSISYYDLGYATGEMAYEVLVNGADISAMDVRFAPSVTKEYNAEMCALLGIQIPADYVPIQ